MPNYFVPSLRTKTAKKADGEKLEKGNPENLRSSDDVESESIPKPGNIFHPAKIFKLGENGSGTRPLGEIQDFNVLRKQCLDEGTLFEDAEFPAELSSVYGSNPAEKDIQWLRPREILESQEIEKDPQFFVNRSRFDVIQGEPGNSWVIAAIASLATHETLLPRVVPEGQSFDKDYAGIFHFTFWQYGRWVDVVIDDRLPIYDDKLWASKSATDNEFWVALLEKAYAKLHGSYIAIEEGFPGEAMEDFTGGVAEFYSGPFPNNFFDVLLRAHEENALLGCQFKKIEENAIDEPNGLYEDQQYSITKVKLLSQKTGNEEQLVRVRNPWGRSEWDGPWSDESPEWQSISDEQKEEMEFKSADDGEFWMSFQDFKAHLLHVYICHVNPNSVLGNAGQTEWESSMFEGEWVSGVTAGGFRNNSEMFHHNPQYLMTLQGKCTVIVELMQKNRRIQRRSSVNFLSIGFEIIRLKKNPSTKIPKPLDSVYLWGGNVDWVCDDECEQKLVPVPQQFSRHRQVSYRIKLQPGSYCIIPSTEEIDKDGEFMLRVFSEKPHKIEEHHEKLGVDEVDYSRTDQSRDEKLRDEFWKISGVDWQLEWSELLDNHLKYKIRKSGIQHPESHYPSEHACRRVVALLDVDRSGKLIYGEVQQFFLDLDKFLSAFKRACRTSHGVQYLRTFDLRKALNKAGIRVNIHILGRLVRRYGTKDKKITLENFIVCVLRIKNLLSTFKERDPLKTNEAEFTLDEWMDNTLYLW